jgi:plasmid stabilization system protein ParE
MSLYKLKISSIAYNDIEEVFQYGIETFGPFVSKKFLEKLHQKMLALQTQPGRGQLHAELPDSLRYLNIESHMIIYSYSEVKKLVHILRIVHQKVNLKTVELGED